MSRESFPESLWSELQQTLAERGVDGLLAALRLREEHERLPALAFAANAFANREWPNKNLDRVTAIAEAAITELLRQADATDDSEQRGRLIDQANVISYNLSAALAACWPGDELPRRREHHERGLAAALACLAWRRELGKGPLPMVMAHWAEGIHRLSLGDAKGARQAFAASLEQAEAAARGTGTPEELSTDSGFFVVLGHGVLGLAEERDGDPRGRERYQRALDIFERQAAGGGEQAGDARFGADQLREVERRHPLGSRNAWQPRSS